MMDMLKGTVTPKDWIAVGVILAIIAAMVVVYTFFVHTRFEANLNAIIEADNGVQADLRKAHEQKKNIAKLREDTKRINDLVGTFEQRLPSERDIPSMVKEFEDLANEVGLSHALKPEATIRDERKETIPYSVSTFGNFHQTASFINRLERYKRYVKISNLKIGDEDNGVSQATFTLSTYRFIEKESATEGTTESTDADTTPDAQPASTGNGS